MVECDPSKVETRVRFPTSAQGLGVPLKTPVLAPVTQLVECGAYRFSSILMARRSRGFDPRQEHFAGLARLPARPVLTGLARLPAKLVQPA